MLAYQLIHNIAMLLSVHISCFTQNELASFCPRSIPRVPAIVVHCVNEIERRGLCTVGLYRVPG